MLWLKFLRVLGKVYGGGGDGGDGGSMGSGLKLLQDPPSS